MRLFSLSLLALLGASLLGACQPPEVVFRLRFPSEETFLLAHTARVEIYDGSGVGKTSPDSICRALSVGQPAPVSTLHSTGARDVCEFLEGIVLENVRVGRLVFSASAEDRQATTILRGCAVLDVLADVSEVEVQLSTLPTYPDTPPADACANVQQKCEKRECG